MKHIKPHKHPKKWMNSLDTLLLFVAIIMPLTAIPQVIEILVLQSAAGVSTLTWLFFFVLSIPWFVYGVVHEEQPIIVAYALWLVVDLTVVVLSLIY